MLIDTLSLSLHLSPCPSSVEVYGLGASVVVAAGHLLRMRKWVSKPAQTTQDVSLIDHPFLQSNAVAQENHSAVHALSTRYF